MGLEKPPTTSGYKSKDDMELEKAQQERPNKTPQLNKHLSLETKTIQPNTDIPESFLSVYLKSAKIEGKRKIILTNQINKLNLRIMHPENFV